MPREARARTVQVRLHGVQRQALVLREIAQREPLRMEADQEVALEPWQMTKASLHFLAHLDR